MLLTRFALIVLAAVPMLVATATFAQEPGKGRPPQETASIATGQLVKVDASAKTIVIRTQAGSDMQFSYTDDTRVSGADQGVAGLGTLTGTPVAVHFLRKDQVNLATQIVVQKKKS